MINHLRGKVIEKNPASIVIECNGVGYQVNISLYTYEKIAEQENIKILTHLQISEDSQSLYGFADEEERFLFRMLISVSGIGCNTARMMLSSMNVQEIEHCIIQENAAKLKGIKGIGEKTALRIILELKDKLRKEAAFHPANSPLRVKDEALSALVTLGFTKTSVDKTLDSLLKTNPSASVEELIKQALKAL